jgi:hypothetical protein
MMYHVATGTAFEIVYDPDQAARGGLTIFGFAARISAVYSAAQPPEDAKELEAIARDAIMAFLNHVTAIPARRADRRGMP